jgi:hypothetical protein
MMKSSIKIRFKIKKNKKFGCWLHFDPLYLGNGKNKTSVKSAGIAHTKEFNGKKLAQFLLKI